MGKIVVSLITDKQTFQRMQEKDARLAAGSHVELEVLFANGSAGTQRQQLTACIGAPPESRPAAIVVEPVSAAGLEIVARNAVQAGIGWVQLGSMPEYLSSLASRRPDVPVTAVADDNLGIGKLQAWQFKALLPSGGKVVYLEGPSGSEAVSDRRRGMQEGLAGTSIRVVKTLTGDWTEGSGERAVLGWLAAAGEQRPDLIGCQNDAMASGARKAIMAQRRAWSTVLLTGCDGLPDEGQRLVREGTIAATVVKPTTAGRGVELMMRALRGEPLPAAGTLPVRSVPRVEELSRKASGSGSGTPRPR